MNLVSTVMTLLSKWHNLAMLCMPRTRGETMIKLAIAFCISLTMFSAFGQSASKYQVGTITDVKTHQDADGRATGAGSYDVSLRIGETIYVVLYTPPLGEETVKYAAGRELLVLVGRRTIRYNDMLGQSFEVPIESQRSAAKPKPAKPVSPPTE
jgi:hypothetical protein